MSSQASQTVGDRRPPPKRVLVLGCSGMVGRSWTELLSSNQIDCDGVTRPEFDLMNPESIVRCLDHHQYDLVVNAAAWTDVDGAESDENGAIRANADAVRKIAQHCQLHDTSLITYSTDYVFSGDAHSPYSVHAPINPINAYGRSKALCESMLCQSDAASLLIRTSWVYAPWGTNFVRTILNLAQSRNELRVVNDQRGRPTSAQQLAYSSYALYLTGAQGFWHLTDNDECTWFDLAKEIVRYAELECDVLPCNSNKFPKPAARPSYSTLDISESIKLIGTIGSWQSHLHQVIDTILSSTSEQS